MNKRPITCEPWAVFAVPGDLSQLTGGYLFDRHLIHALKEVGRAICHVALPVSFPRPTRSDAEETRKILLGTSPDVPVIIDGLAGGAIDTSVLRDMRAPYIALTHHPLAFETGLSRSEAGYFKSLERDNLALARHVIVTSPYTARLLQREYDIDPAKITIALPSLPTRIVGREKNAGKVEILSVGLLAPRKGHDVLLDALARITDLDWTANIVGRVQDRAYADALYARQQRLGLSSRVRFTGEIPEAQLSSYFASASVFALASRFEGYGIAFSEALAAGLPVVGCNSGAVPFTVPEDAGLLVPPDDPAALAEALRHLLEDPAVRENMRKAARRHASDLPTWEDTAQIVSKVISAVRRQEQGH